MFQKDILCALSGGGFRATFFHAGVLRSLVRLGLKDNIKVISSVSGGSITSALFGLNYDKIATVDDFDKLVLTPLKYFSKRDPRNTVLKYRTQKIIFSMVAGVGSLLGPLGKPLSLFATRQNSDYFIEQLDEHLFHGKSLGDLSKSVRVVINATNLNNGARFRFDNVDFGDYKIGYSYDVDHLPVSFAVTASACFPGLFSPLKFDISRHKFTLRNKQKQDSNSPNIAPESVFLSDGGLYDNLGYFSIEKELERGRDGFVIISDAANRFYNDSTDYGFMNSGFRIIGILMEQVSNRDRIQIFKHFSNETWAGIIMKLENTCRSYREFIHDKCVDASSVPLMGWSDSIVNRIAQIRTDLNVFTESEIQALVYHGETVVETQLAKWHNNIYKELCASVEPTTPIPPQYSEKEIYAGLEQSHRRFKAWDRIKQLLHFPV